jgi:opacity protein-like surface antigen
LLSLLLAVAAPASAQSRFPRSLQASWVSLGAVGRFSEPFDGFEVQYRQTFNRLSVGGGLLRTRENSGFFVFTPGLGESFTTEDYDRTDLFLEPRYVAAVISRIALYGAARVGYARIAIQQNGAQIASTGYVVYGGGGGIMVQLNDRLAADVGYQLHKYDVVDSFTQLRIGATLGF